LCQVVCGRIGRQFTYNDPDTSTSVGTADNAFQLPVLTAQGNGMAFLNKYFGKISTVAERCTQD
jgi:hypothetical protein